MAMSLIATPDTVQAYVDITSTHTTEETSTQDFPDYETVASITITPKKTQNLLLRFKVTADLKTSDLTKGCLFKCVMASGTTVSLSSTSETYETVSDWSAQIDLTPASSYQLDILICATLPGATAYAKNIIIQLNYLDNVGWTTAGSKWSAWS